MSFIIYPGELNHAYIDGNELKSFIDGRLDDLYKLRSDCEFRIKNIVSQDEYDVNDEYDMEKIHKIQMEIRVLIGSINAYEELLKELA